MNDETVRVLNDINRRFYREHAAEFSATRAEPWPGWTPLIALLAQLGLDRDLSVLDLGCGNGRFARFLRVALAPREFRYVGIDASPELLKQAGEGAPDTRDFTWICGDFVEVPATEVLPPGPFSLIALFGVLHGIPGRDQRRALLAAAADRLRPGGLLTVTAWRLDAFARFADKLLPCEQATPRIDARELEAGDRLLPWGNGDAVRYCHTGGEAEAEALLAELPLERVADWRADGRENSLNRYFALRRDSA